MIPEDVLPQEIDWHGDVQALAGKVRRSPQFARDLHLTHLVRFVSARWRTSVDLYTVSDEAPLTAWIIRRKSDLVLPQPEEEAPPDEAEPSAQRENLWLESASAALQELLRESNLWHMRPQGIRPMPLYHPVKGASAAKLTSSWPRLRPARVAPMHFLDPDDDPLPTRMARVVALLRDTGSPTVFTDLLTDQSTPEIVSTFLAVVHLWHRRTVDVQQSAAYQEIWVEAGKADAGGN